MPSIAVKYAPSGWENNPAYTYFGRPRRGKKPQDCEIGEHGWLGNPCARGEECPVCSYTHIQAGATLECYEQYLRQRLTEPEFLAAAKKVSKFKVCFCGGPTGLGPKDKEICHVQVFERVMKEFK